MHLLRTLWEGRGISDGLSEAHPRELPVAILLLGEDGETGEAWVLCPISPYNTCKKNE